jgi:hypothetical protein
MKRLLFLAALAAAPAAAAGGIIDGVIEQGRREMFPPAPFMTGGAPEVPRMYPCLVRDLHPTDRPTLLPMFSPLDFSGWKVTPGPALEPADTAMYHAFRSSLCLEGSTDCLNWYPSGFELRLAASR